MERNDIAKKIREIIDNLLVVTTDKEVPETSKLVDDLQMDDLDRVELIMSIEEAFNLDIREDYKSFNTVEELINYVETHQVVDPAAGVPEESAVKAEAPADAENPEELPEDQLTEGIEVRG